MMCLAEAHEVCEEEMAEGLLWGKSHAGRTTQRRCPPDAAGLITALFFLYLFIYFYTYFDFHFFTRDPNNSFICVPVLFPAQCAQHCTAQYQHSASSAYPCTVALKAN